MKIDEMNIADFEQIKNNLTLNFDNFWNEEILKEEILNENRKYYVIKDENEILGFAGVSIIDFEAELMNIVIRKDRRGEGIGKALLEKIIDVLKSMNVKLLKLEVNEKNTNAIKMYESAGFKRVREAKTDIMMMENLKRYFLIKFSK